MRESDLRIASGLGGISLLLISAIAPIVYKEMPEIVIYLGIILAVLSGGLSLALWGRYFGLWKLERPSEYIPLKEAARLAYSARKIIAILR